MLRLLRKSLANHNEQFLKIVYVCAGVHLLLLLVACFITHDDALHINLSVAPGARVVCVPSFMASSSTAQMKKQKTAQARSAQRATSAPAKKVTKNSQKNVRTEQKRTPVKTAIAALVPVASRKKNQKNSSKKAIPQKIVETVHKEEIEPEKITESEVPAVQSSEPSDEVIYVNKDTYQLLEIAQQLQEAISKQWSPPAGMISGLVCQVRVTVDAHGKATTLEVVAKSGVAVFDMAARKALLESDYPASVRGKTIVVDFNEEFL